MTLLGWFYVLHLSNRALKRSDISRVKDSCISVIEETVKTIVDLKDSNNSNELTIEAHLDYLATKLEFKIKALNSLTSCEIYNPGEIGLKIRSADSRKLAEIDLVYKRQLASNLLNACEDLENKYQEFYFTRSLRKIYLRYEHEIKGLAFSIFILAMLSILFRYI